MDFPFVSIIVPHLNDHERLRTSLNALSRQDYPSEKYEIIVVDNNSDKPLDAVQAEFPHVRFSVERQRGCGMARNHGVDIAQVFTAGDIMDKQQVTVVERPGMGVRAALESLRRHDRNFAVVVGSDRHYEGLVSADSLARTLKESDEPGFREAFEDVEPVRADGLLDELIGRLAETAAPIPVVDEDGRYLGAVSRSRLLRTLDRTSDTSADTGDEGGGSHE